MWNVEQYQKYADERARPFFDLLGQILCEAPRQIVDLGCGPGTLTRTLAERWPAAQVLGVDNSPEMLAKAGSEAIPGRLSFEQADISAWTSDGPCDLIVSNAALQWIGDHERLLARLAEMLAPQGTLALQMPNRFHTASQLAIDETMADPRWSGALQGVGLHRDSIQPLAWYVDRLHDLGFQVNAWETIYYHVMTGENPVLEWLKGTGLRPLLDRLSPELSREFERAAGERLIKAYPARKGITVFPMPRVFFVATR